MSEIPTRASLAILKFLLDPPEYMPSSGEQLSSATKQLSVLQSWQLLVCTMAIPVYRWRRTVRLRKS